MKKILMFYYLLLLSRCSMVCTVLLSRCSINGENTKTKVPLTARWRGDKMFLEIQLSVIKSGCHPDSWLESEDQRSKKAADVSLVGGTGGGDSLY